MKKITIIVIAISLIAVGFGIYKWSTTGSLPAPSDNQNYAQSPPPTEPVPQLTPTPTTAPTTKKQTQNMKHLITLKTSLGDIQFETYDADAPKAVNNFITLAGKGFYNNVIFHRIIKGFMAQGGDPTGTGMGGPGYKFEDELNPATPSYLAGYRKGVVAMANAGPNTNGSQFFIMLADYQLPNAYTIFGKVIKGQDVVDAMGNLQTGANDRPVTPPVIKSVTVEEVK
jgi:cyclophilin family peptidyl-prolyl cis-trans isomerase